jgi:hypothetical protein
MKLNLGCGSKTLEGFVNVDKFPTATTDVVLDLEKTPWPWEADSVEEIRFIHSLEHMGQDTNTYLSIIKEIYRVCRGDAVVVIHAPHPRHDNYLGDPTHVRPITPQSLSLFDAELNRQWLAGGVSAATPLGLYIGVDFEIIEMICVLDPAFHERYGDNELSDDEINRLARELNNVISEYHLKLRVRKS